MTATTAVYQAMPPREAIIVPDWWSRLVVAAAQSGPDEALSVGAVIGAMVVLFASGMALGMVLDATVIRAVLVAATVAMMGMWNWWLPDQAAKLPRVEPSPLRSGKVHGSQ